MITNYKNNEGFSLLEVIISVGIISSCVVSVMYLFSQNTQMEIRNKNKLTAIYLAQEQMEIVRQQRDNAWYVVDGAWLDKIPENTTSIVNMINLDDVREGYTLIEDSTPAHKNIYCKGETSCTENLYIQSSFDIPTGYLDTGFDRWATITQNGEFIDVVSNVKDSQGNITSVETSFYPWQWH